MTKINSMAGKSARPEDICDLNKLIIDYYQLKPDPNISEQKVAFGTSGHRGSSFTQSFNENHILAITQAICDYRQSCGMKGPIFIGIDTHALSVPALQTALEVLVGNQIKVYTAPEGCYTPTPAVSHAILSYNKRFKSSNLSSMADGIVVTPSHNPPSDGGFKYNPTHGGPAELQISSWIETRANEILLSKCQGVKRATSAQLKLSNFIQTYDFQAGFISDLKNVIDFEVIKGSNLHLGVDPLGGAGVYYWAAIAEKYGINLTVVRSEVDKTFRFMTLDWDGKIRMDPSSKYAMQSLIDLKDDFDIAFAADTDHDRHGIVTRSSGLMPSNDYLAVMAYYLLTNRTSWPDSCAVAKTVVSTSLINKVAKGLNKKVFEFPVGFKWFAQGLKTAEFNFAGEESAGASFSRLDGTVWTTDKDGITAGLLAGEIMARTGKDPAQIYQTLLTNYGAVFSGRLDAPISFKQKKILKQLDETKISINHLAGDKITAVMTKAPANGEPIGGIKIVSEGGWFAARPSGTENIYKIYTESFKSLDHLVEIQQEAQKIVQEIIEPKK